VSVALYQYKYMHDFIGYVLRVRIAPVLIFCIVRTALAGGSHPMLQTSFDIPVITGNPFDLSQNDVRVTFKAPNGITGTIPAFFDGGTTWRARFTPTTPGIYSVTAVTLNGQDANPVNLNPTQFQVAGSVAPGFIRLDPKNKMRFIFDDGSPYYPLGFNLAWRGDGQPPLTQSLDRMGAAGVNWTRIWMNHWDEKNLDWPKDGADPMEIGQLSLSVARQWDQIVSAAEAGEVYLQLVLQHHGQFSSTTDANWPQNPWNKGNGGWLENSGQFFTDPRAIALTTNKYRYIIARWGYSPAIMAWELFNEIEWTDLFKSDLDSVAAWHQTMADFIREQDPYRHLITTSSQTAESSLWSAMDYYQPHVYTHDLTSAMATLDRNRLDRPYFYGEFGGRAAGNSSAREDLHKGLWASLMSGAGGAAQFWFWDIIQSKNLLNEFTAARSFIQRSGLLHESGIKPIEVIPRAPQLDALAKGNADLVVMWVFNRAPEPGQPISGSLEIPGLPAGNYAVTWINTQTGEITKSDSAAVSPGVALTLTTPSIAQDAACWVRRLP
jgi:hypothetical protein